MRRKLMFGLTFAALVALGTVAAFADDDVLPSRANSGPHFARHMVARRDVGTGFGHNPAPTVPGKPPETAEARLVGRTVSGQKNVGGTLGVTPTSPQTMLENSLSSLSKELR